MIIIFFTDVMKLVRLGKYEKLCLGEVMRGIKVCIKKLDLFKLVDCSRLYLLPPKHLSVS